MRSISITTALVVTFLLAAGATASVVTTAAKPKRAKSGLTAPALQSPRDDVTSDVVPAFTWGAVRRAAGYEFQLSADGAFRSSVFGRGNTSLQTKNTAATVTIGLADGNYFWRVRAIDAKGNAGPWSRTRTLHKDWSQTPALQSPANSVTIHYPQPLVLSWSAVPRAFKYDVTVATDPALGSPAPGFAKPVETSGTDFAVPIALPVGQYYWAVTPLDSDKHPGQRSAVGSFQVDWPTTIATHVNDLNADDRVYDPQLSWDPVPGAARYEVELNTSADFAAGSKVCCKDPTTGTSLSPTHVLPNNTGDGGGYFWRVRAIDVDGNAGVWNVGPSFPKYFSPANIPSVPNLHMVDHTTPVAQTGIPDLATPVVAWDPAPGAASYEIQVAPVEEDTTTFQSATATTVTVGSTQNMIPSSAIWFATETRHIAAILDATHVQIDSPLSTAPAPGSAVTFASGLCNWTPATPESHEFWDVRTASTAWSPLAPVSPVGSPVGSIFSGTSRDGSALLPQQSYCVRIRARGDRDANNKEVVSAWTELGNFLGGRPSFSYDPGPDPTCAAITPTQTSDYLTPAFGEVTPRMPFFAWQPVAGACSYWVVVARDESFTDIVDVALTWDPEYAPRNGSNPRTYTDEQSSYYWAVIPAPSFNGSGVWTRPEDNAPQQFQKRSVPPTLLAPANGGSVTTQPTFRWTSAEGAREYHLQVAQDPTFSNPIDDVLTDATAFTSSSTYPADTVLYWRVRADDENKVGLAWSEVHTFRRQLLAPRPSADNPTGGRTIPVLNWSAVEGAISYDVHVDQPDGTHKDFNVRSTSFTPTAHYGTGIWQWEVRANFPKLPFGSTPGPYSSSTPFTRFIGSPAGARGVFNPSRLLLSWDPVEMTKSYRVQISTSSSFNSTIDSQTTENTTYAPKLTAPAFKKAGTLYWRVASVDEGNNVGGYTEGRFSPKRLRLAVRGKLRRDHSAKVVVRVTDRGRRVANAKVRVSGPGMPTLARRTTRSGAITFVLRPRRSGKAVFQASKGGYRAVSVALKVAR